MPRAKKSANAIKAESPPPVKRQRTASPVPESSNAIKTDAASSPQLRKKMKAMSTYKITPFPDYVRPLPEECQAVCDALATVHTLPQRPAEIKQLDNVGANCGQVPDVLDALCRWETRSFVVSNRKSFRRTILSQNTSNKNSTAARKGIEEVFGKGPNYEAVRLGTQDELMEAIRCGGLAKVKSKVIKNILDECVAWLAIKQT
jgi:endonuclease-3